MANKLFGTDGIRGTANKPPMTAEIALSVGEAAGAHFLRGDHRHRVIIAKDTRREHSRVPSDTVVHAGTTVDDLFDAVAWGAAADRVTRRVYLMRGECIAPLAMGSFK